MMHAMARCPIFGAALLAGFVIPGPSRADPPDNGADCVFVGYLFGHPRNINFRLYTHLFHAFLVADGEGNVRRGRGVPSKDLTDEAHKAGVKVVLSLGGWGWDQQFASIQAWIRSCCSRHCGTWSDGSWPASARRSARSSAIQTPILEVV